MWIKFKPIFNQTILNANWFSKNQLSQNPKPNKTDPNNISQKFFQKIQYQSSYGIDMDVILLLVWFEHRYCVHCLNTNVICIFKLFKHKCYMSIHVVYTWKLCTQILCFNNAQHSYLNNTNFWNNRFRIDLEQTYQTCKCVMFV